MPTIDGLLDEIFAGHERVGRDEIHRRAVAADLPADDLSILDTLPEGEYSHDEAVDALGQHVAEAPDAHSDELVEGDGDEGGVPPEDLSDDDLLRELAILHQTRHETFLHASTQALQHHSERTRELELEYLRRHPERDIDTDRLRSGARERG